jgi:hypothetical protein
MKASKFRISVTLVLACCYSVGKAQSFTLVPVAKQTIAKTDSTVNLKLIGTMNFKRYAPMNAFVMKPKYTKAEGSPVPIPNTYTQSKDLSKPIPTLKINNE